MINKQIYVINITSNLAVINKLVNPNNYNYDLWGTYFSKYLSTKLIAIMMHSYPNFMCSETWNEKNNYINHPIYKNNSKFLINTLRVHDIIIFNCEIFIFLNYILQNL